jgi:hypothetical protein
VADGADATVPQPPPVRFSPPDPYNVLSAADSLGGGAAPVMAGFAVALLGLTVDIQDKLLLPGVAAAFFALAAVSLAHVVQVNGQARSPRRRPWSGIPTPTPPNGGRRWPRSCGGTRASGRTACAGRGGRSTPAW